MVAKYWQGGQEDPSSPQRPAAPGTRTHRFPGVRPLLAPHSPTAPLPTGKAQSQAHVCPNSPTGCQRPQGLTRNSATILDFRTAFGFVEAAEAKGRPVSGCLGRRLPARSAPTSALHPSRSPPASRQIFQHTCRRAGTPPPPPPSSPTKMLHGFGLCSCACCQISESRDGFHSTLKLTEQLHSDTQEVQLVQRWSPPGCASE